MARLAGSSTPSLPAFGVLVGAVVMLLALGCDELTGLQGEVVWELAWLDKGGSNSLQVEVPASVEKGAPFDVTFMTYAGTCVAPDAFEVETTVRGLVAEIVPYHLRRVPAPGAGCPDRGWFREREVTLRFERAGQAVIVLRGRGLVEGDTTELALTYEVEVVEGR